MSSQTNIYFENGHINDDAVALYVDALVQDSLPDLQDAVMIHVGECHQCKDKVLELTTFLRNPDASPAVHFLEQPQQQKRRRWIAPSMRIAASLFTAALLVSAYFLVYKDGSFIKRNVFEPEIYKKTTDTRVEKTNLENQKPIPSKNLVAQRDTTKTTSKKDPKIDNSDFQVNPNLENMIDSQYRSSVTKVLSPRNNARLSGDITFKWEKVQSARPALTLKILDNKNKLFCEYEVSGNGFVLKEKLPPGLFYWKLENREDLLYIGKFFIK